MEGAILTMSVTIFSIRHHGPGSARNMLQALEALQPDIVLVEGPAEGQEMIQWVNHPDMKPPVALLAYEAGNPQQAVFYPFTFFSPEWNAILFAQKKGIPVRFADMPLTHWLARKNISTDEGIPQNETSEKPVNRDPFSHLASISGFEDTEEWWEHHFELNENPIEAFDALTEAVKALREHFPSNDPDEPIREAFMRKAIRQAQREMFTKIAFVCGAWHAPALALLPSQKEDDQLTKNLPKVKVETTWVPWTNDRLSFWSGYGAGVESPGWYHHIWNYPKDDGTRWLSKTAEVFRNNRMDISSAHIIESVRLANALTSLRNLQRPGLKEMTESTQTVMCMGDPLPLSLVYKGLIVGTEMGEIPEGTPQVPLQQDFEKTLKSLRLKISDQGKLLKLDLREENDLQKSILLHRLLLMEVKWGDARQTRGKGTFKEEWELYWKPEYTISLIEKAAWGNTIESAANNWLVQMARGVANLAGITELVEKAIPSELKAGTDELMKRLDQLAASTSDTELLMQAFIPLVRITRYGNVRQTDTEMIAGIMEALFYRVLANLPGGCSNINEDLASSLAEKIKQMDDSVQLLDRSEFREAWLETLTKLSGMQHADALIQGICSKIVYDAGLKPADEMAALFSRALSTGNEPSFSARWVEGFMKDGAMALLLDDNIWALINNWLNNIEEADFISIVPLLRRTFSLYSAAEKRKIAARAGSDKPISITRISTTAINEERGLRALTTLRKIIGMAG
jgi:hypothetical protein